MKKFIVRLVSKRSPYWGAIVAEKLGLHEQAMSLLKSHPSFPAEIQPKARDAQVTGPYWFIGITLWAYPRVTAREQYILAITPKKLEYKFGLEYKGYFLLYSGRKTIFLSWKGVSSLLKK